MEIKKDPYKFLLFLISPALSLLDSIIDYRNKKSGIYFVLVGVIFGATFIFVGSSDSTRILLNIDAALNFGWDRFSDFVFAEGKIDIFLPTLTFFISKIYPNYHLLYAILGFIFSLFFTLTMKKLIAYQDKYNVKKLTLSSIVILIVALLTVRASAFNGARWWIAAFIFTYSLFRILENKKDVRGYLWLASTAFIHFSFILVFAIVGTYYIIGKKKIICYTLCVSSFFASLFFQNFLDSKIGLFFSEDVVNRYEVYTKDGNIESYAEKLATANWYVTYGTKLALNGAMSVILASLFIKKQRKDEKRLLFFLVIYLSFVNVLSFSQVITSRFGWILTFLTWCYLFRLSLYNKTNFVKLLTITALITSTPLIILNIRAATFHIDVSMLFPIFLIPFLPVMSIGEIVDSFFKKL